MRNPSDAELERWITQNWQERPPWAKSAFIEQWQEEQRSRAEEWAKDHRNAAIVDVRRRVRKLEHFISIDAKHGLLNLLGSVVADLHRDIFKSCNAVRKDLGAPELKPRIRVPAGRGETW